MARDSQAYAFGATQIVVGLSAIVGVTVGVGQIYTFLKKDSGGTLWVGGPSIFPGGTYGYHMATADAPLRFESSGTFYMAAAGATVVTYLISGLTTPTA